MGQQRPGRDTSIDIDGNERTPEEYKAAPEDTIPVRIFTLADIENKTVFADTTLDDIEIYAKVRTLEKGAFTLGNLGSSQYPLIYRPKSDILTDPGFHQYDIYKTELTDFEYHEHGRTAFNDYSFTPVSGNANTQFRARFSNNFADNTVMSINMDRIKQDGFYSNQTTKSTAFGFGIWKSYPEKNRQMFITFLANNHNENHNGGITSLGENRVRLLDPTFITEASTRHQDFKYAADNFFSLSDDKYKAHHQLVLQHGYFIFSDEETDKTNDTLTYTENYITDSRGIRYFLGFQKVKNTLDVAFDSRNIGLKLGVQHLWSRFKTDVATENIHDLIAFSELDLSVGHLAELAARLEVGIGDNSGNLMIDGLLTFKPTRGLDINAHLLISRYDPTLIQRSVNISERNVFTTDFSKVNELQLGGKLAYRRIGLELSFNSGILTSPIHYNAAALPVQKDGTTEYIQAMVKHRFFWRFIGLENSGCFQEFTDNLYLLPRLYSIHDAYLQFRLFKKKLLVRVGGIYYNIQSDEQLAFLPVTGTFYPSGQDFEAYPYTEAYTTFHIGDFRMFVKMENIVDQFQPQVHYQILNHPQFDRKLRMGIRWLMRG